MDQLAAGAGRTFAIVSALCASLLALACDDRKSANRPRVSDRNVQVERVAAQSEPAARPMDDDFAADAERQMQRLREQIDALGERARKAGAEARVRLERRIAELEPRWREAEARLAQARGKTDTALREARGKFEKAFESLRRSVRDAKKEFDRS